jgi:hypothetical protein
MAPGRQCLPGFSEDLIVDFRRQKRHRAAHRKCNQAFVAETQQRMKFPAHMIVEESLGKRRTN